MKAYKKTIEDIILLANDAHGVYMTKVFLERFKDSDSFILDESFNEDIEIVLNSDPYSEEWYWESVGSIIDNARLLVDGIEYFIAFVEGGLWALPDTIEQEEIDKWLLGY